jgi:hypothetical protein
MLSEGKPQHQPKTLPCQAGLCVCVLCSAEDFMNPKWMQHLRRGMQQEQMVTDPGQVHDEEGRNHSEPSIMNCATSADERQHSELSTGGQAARTAPTWARRGYCQEREHNTTTT